MNNPISRPYTIPKKIDTIVKTHVGELLARIRGNQEGCPLYGYDGVQGCAALRDPFCYLENGSRRQSQVETPVDCPVYRRVMEVIKAPLEGRCTAIDDTKRPAWADVRQAWQKWE